MPSASMQVKIGADITELAEGLTKAQRLALYASDDFKKAFEASQANTGSQKALNAEIDQSTMRLAQMTRAANLNNKTIVAALQQEVAAQKEWAQAVGATTDQMFKLALVEARVDNASEKIRDQTRAVSGLTGELTGFGKKGLSVFSGVLLAATQFGNDGSTAVQKVLTGASGLALAFGPEGAVVSALASGALAFVNYFTKARDEMQKTREKFAEELAAMQNEGGVKGQVGIQSRLRTIEQGTPAAGGADGLIGMRVRQSQLATQVAAEKPVVDRFGEVRKAASPAAKELGELTAKIIELDTQAQNLKYALLNPPSVPADITGIRPFEIHGKDPFSTKKEKAVKQLSPLATEARVGLTPSDGLMASARIPGSVIAPESIFGKMAPVRTAIPALFDPKTQASMDRVAESQLKQVQANDRLRNTMSAVGAQFVQAAASFIASKIGGGSAAAGFGAGVGGMLGGAIAGKFAADIAGKGLGAVLGSAALPVVGTLVGTLAGGLIGKGLGALFGSHTKHVDANAAALDKASTAANKLTESLTNVPSGFKIALYGYRAQIPAPHVPNVPNVPDGPNGGGTGYTPGAPPRAPGSPGTSYSIGVVNVYANDPAEFQRKMEQEAARGGSTMQPQSSSFRPQTVAAA